MSDTKTPSRLSIRILVCLACSILGSSISMAAPITVINPGFEDITGETENNEFTFGPLNGWSLYNMTGVNTQGSGNGIFIGTLEVTAPTYYTAGAPEGGRVGIAFNNSSVSGSGEYGLQQTLTDNVQANTSYELVVEVGNIASGTSTSGTFFNLDGFPGYRIDILAGGTVIAQDNNSLAGTIAEGTFESTNIQFSTGVSDAAIGQTLGIRLVNLNVPDALFPGANLEVNFDNLQFSATAVPEPATTLALLGLTVVSIFRRQRSRYGSAGSLA